MSWIKLSEEEPEIGQRVIAYVPSGDTDQPLICVCVYAGDYKFDYLFDVWQGKVTKWKSAEDNGADNDI